MSHQVINTSGQYALGADAARFLTFLSLLHDSAEELGLFPDLVFPHVVALQNMILRGAIQPFVNTEELESEE